MHYKNGREVKVGDQFVTVNKFGNAATGVVVRVPEGDYISYAPGNSPLWSAPAIDSLHVEDAFQAFELAAPGPSGATGPAAPSTDTTGAQPTKPTTDNPAYTS